MTAVLQDLPRRATLPAWPRALVALAAALALILLLYRETAAAMVGIWLRSETFQHAFLVLPIVLWLAWRMRDRLAPLRPSPAPLWLLPIALLAFVWLIGDLGEVNAVTQLAFVALLVSAVPAVLGNTVARALAFPLGFLFFAVPLGEFTMPWLMARTADFTVGALQLSGIPVYREGQEFVIPSGSWSVIEACSGVRYLIASVMVGTLFAYLNFNSLRRRVAFVGVAILIPVLANWLRAYMIVMIGHLSSNRLATGVDHLVYGWAFFGVVMTVMFVIGIRWSEPEPEPEPATRPEAVAVRPAWREPARSRQSTMFFAAAAGVVTLVVLPHLVLRVLTASEAAAPARLAAPDLAATGWPAHADRVSWTPAFVNPSVLVQRSYRAGAVEVGLSIAYYRGQSGVQGEERKLVSSVNALVTTKDKVWRQLASGLHTVELGGRPVVVRSARVAGFPGAAGAERALRVWQFYWVGDVLTGSDVAAKAWGVAERLRHGRDDGAAIMVSTRDDPTAEATLTVFLHDNLGAITAALRAARDAR